MKFGGYFNVVSSKEERVGVGGRSRQGEMEEFNKFIKETDLIDVLCCGGSFFISFNYIFILCDSCELLLILDHDGLYSKSHHQLHSGQPRDA